MQRGVLIISAAMIIGAIIYMAANTATPATNSVATPVAATLAVVANNSSTGHSTIPTAIPALLGPSQPAGPESSNSSAVDWLMEGSNPARTRSTLSALGVPLTQRRDIGIPGTSNEDGSPPVIGQGKLIIETADNLRAFDLSNGQQIWTYSEHGNYISPAIAGNRVFIRSESNNKGQVIALDLATGQQIWAFAPKRISDPSNNFYGGHITSPVIVDGIVYIGAGKEVYALDAATGQNKWIFSAQDYITSSPSVTDKQIYISDFSYVYSINREHGDMRWATPIKTGISFSSVATSDVVLISNGSNLAALEASTGKQRWELAIPGESLIPAAADAMHAYAKSTQTLYALDLATGKEIWRFSDQNFVSLPVVSNSQLFLVSGMGADTTVRALNVANGNHAWEQPVQKLATTAPIIAGQAIYVRTTDGRIVAFSS